MSTNTNKYGTNIHSNEFIVLPITALDTPLEIAMFANGDEHYSINGHALANDTRKVKYTNDGLYAFYGIVVSDLKNDVKELKAFAKTVDLDAGTEDFTSNVGDEFWILNYPELLDWLNVSPHNL